MPKWKGKEVETIEETIEYWSSSENALLESMMHVSKKKQLDWLKVSMDIVTIPGSVYEPGCGYGLMAEVLPENCTYYGVDLNADFVLKGQEIWKDNDKVRVVLGDAFEVEEEFDWVVVSSLFGMFPLEDSYKLMEKLWSQAKYGMAISTLNFHKYDNPRARKNRLTSHKPEEMLKRIKGFEGVSQIRMATDIKDGNLNRKFATFIYREGYEGELRTPEYKRSK